MKVSHAWMQKYFDSALPSAHDCADMLTFHSFEVEGVEHVDSDEIIDIAVLPNRSSDCLSHRGVARELSTVCNLPMAYDPFAEPISTYEKPTRFSVTIDDSALCKRYMGAVLRGVTVGESPLWLKEALERVGQRSINNVVDATNYVMLDLGQPLHVFDRAKLAENDEGARLHIRNARLGETITVLGGSTYTLTDRMVLVTDGVSDTPLAIAGVKGGIHAEVSVDTKDIILESASFDPVSVRKTSHALKLMTDASLRFQNEPATTLAGFAMRDLIALIISIAGGTFVGVYDTDSATHVQDPVSVSLEHINVLLGTDLTQQDVESILVRFGWEFSFDGRTFTVTPPWERTDITIPAALVEEIGRVYGFSSIQSKPPMPCTHHVAISPAQYYSDKVRTFLIARGYDEVLTYMFQPDGEVEIMNPLASDKAFIRKTLRTGVAEALEVNILHTPVLGLDDVRIFEIGSYVTNHGEMLALAMGVKGIRTKQSKLEQQLAHDVEMLNAELGTTLSGSFEQGVFETVLDDVFKKLPVPKTYSDPLPWNSATRFTQWSLYPFVLRDIAVWVPAHVPSEKVLAVIIEVTPSLLVRHDQFDTFEKDGRVSYAWHLVFQAFDRTLTDEEVNGVMDMVSSALQSKEGWDVR